MKNDISLAQLLDMPEEELMYFIQANSEYLVTNGLGCEKIPHYGDTEVGLIRHLATMNLRCLSSYSSQILHNLRYKLDKL